MKRVPIREFQRNAAKYMNELPIALTRYRRVICEVHDPVRSTMKQAIAETTDLKKVDVKKDVKNMQKEQDIEYCEHGFMFGLCKHGCDK